MDCCGRAFKLFVSLACALAPIFLCLSCSQPTGEFFYGSLGLGTPRLVVATQNTSGNNIVLYDLEGHLVDVIWDGTALAEIPRGIAPFDGFNLAIAIEGVDRLGTVNIANRSTGTLATNAALTGNMYQLTYDTLSARYYAIETNTIEAFTRSGLRVGNPYINTTLGSCTISTARGVHATADGRLFVANTGNHRLLVYDVSDNPATCLSSNAGFGTNQPIAVIAHSNGLIYVATNANHEIYSLPNDGTGTPTVVWNANITQIRNPTALLEMPDGTLLVASDQTNSIERITTSGEYVGGTSFIKDAFTGLVTQMMLIGGE